jgi:hypothetical protein
MGQAGGGEGMAGGQDLILSFVARMNEATSGKAGNAVPDIASLIQAIETARA